jgi:hypothetical protein
MLLFLIFRCQTSYYYSNSGRSSSGSKLLQQQQQNYSFIAELSGDNNTIPPVNTNARGIAKFEAKDPNYNNSNELFYEINLTNMHNYLVKVDVHIGKNTQNGPSVITLYQRTLSLPSEICCRSAASESERTKFFSNVTISTQNFEFGPLVGSKNITDLVRLFDSGNAYLEGYTYQPKSLNLSDSDSEIRGQIVSIVSVPPKSTFMNLPSYSQN